MFAYKKKTGKKKKTKQKKGNHMDTCTSYKGLTSNSQPNKLVILFYFVILPQTQNQNWHDEREWEVIEWEN